MITNLTELKNLEAKTFEDLQRFVGSPFKSKTFGEGIISGIESIVFQPKMYDMVMRVSLNGSEKTFYLQPALVHVEKTPEIEEIIQTLTDIATERDAYLAEVSRQHAERAAEIAKQREAERLAAEARLAEAKRKKKIKNTLAKYQALKSEDAKLIITDNFYITLGWLAKHVGTIRATMPECLEEAFIKDFGEGAERTVVSSDRKTSGGYDMQFTFSFKMSVKDYDQIPLELANKVNDKNLILDTQFIYTLCSEYGFLFGKLQDKEHIMTNIPKSHRAEFEVGYNS